MVRATLEALLDALEDNTELLRIVADELPRTRTSARAEALEQRVTGLVSAYLAARRTGAARTPCGRPRRPGSGDERSKPGRSLFLERPSIDRDDFVAESSTGLGYLLDA